MRSEERRRRNKTTESGEPTEVDKLEVDDERPAAPPAREGWHDMAKDFYQACCDSPQSVYYELSDYAALQLMCEDMSRNLKEQVVGIAEKTGEAVWEVLPFKGATLGAYNKLMASLLVTEGDRRRLRIEIERKSAEAELKPKSAEGVVLDRRALFAKGAKK